MKHLAILALFIFAAPAFAQESVMERLANIEATNNRINSMLARQAGDIAVINDRLKAIDEKLEAVVKVAVPGGTFTASTVDEWGRGKAASFSSGQTFQSSSMMMSGYSSGYGAPRRMVRAPVRGILRAVGGVCGN